MKRLVHILVLVCLMAACTPPVETRHGASLPTDDMHPRLAAIDTLMWQQPDSALAVLLDFAGSPLADSLDAFDGHYCQMLVSELLYKNDCEQSNRTELLRAVDYFDSLCISGDVPWRVSTRDIVFLDARAHYINGVGFYERDSIVEACEEYLKTLEIMEERFEEKELVKNKAKFMSYTYSRLGRLFSSQFMMDPAILCYKRAQVFCMIEQTSPYGIPNNYYRIGLQYNKKGQNDSAMYYYEKAIECLIDSNCLVYRNIATNKSLLYYQISKDAELAIQNLKSITGQSANERERLTRYLTIGDVYYEAGIFDSAKFYLEHVFEKKTDEISQIQAAEYLRNIYDSIGEYRKADACVRFLADHKKSEGDNKALTSKLENMFMTYMNQKQGKKAEEAREESIRKTIKIIVPIAIMVSLIVFIMVKLRSIKLLKEQQEEADGLLVETEQAHEEELRRLQAETQQRLEETERKHRQKVEEMVKRHEDELRIQRDQSEKEMEQTRQRHEAELEAERLAYEKEQDALRQSLRQHEDQVRVSEKSLGQQQDKAERWHQEFLKEPICRRINELLHGKRITTRDTSFKHDDITLEEEDFKQLREAVERHFEGFDAFLLSCCPSLKRGDLALCHLHLMGLSEGEIAALKSRTYSGIKKQDESIKEKLSLEESVSEYVLRISEKLVNPSEDIFNGSITNETLSFSQKSSQKNSQKIVELIKKRPGITTSEMAEAAGVSRRTIVNITNKLREKGAIRRVGPDKGGHWEVIE